MTSARAGSRSLPARAGIGLRSPHVAEVLATRPALPWFEVHPENYLGGGPAGRALETIRRDYPLAFHAVGLSVGSATGLDRRHLDRVAALGQGLDAVTDPHATDAARSYIPPQGIHLFEADGTFRPHVYALKGQRDMRTFKLVYAPDPNDKRHLVLFASLREAILSRALAARIDSFDRALTHAATAEYLQRRELAFRRLERGGAVCLDVEPAELPIALVNRYIDIKRSGRL